MQIEEPHWFPERAQMIYSHSTIIGQLRDLGVRPGAVLVVHTAFSRIAPIEGGPDGLIDALHEAIQPSGTLVMPSMSDDDDAPFQVSHTPCAGMGIVADTFWRRNGVHRSDSPHAFAAIGPHAASITADHPYDVPHGLDSPIGRAYELNAQVLLLGVGHDANTTIHLAENLAHVTYKQRKSLTIMKGRTPGRVEYDETDHCCENFALLDDWLDELDLQRRGSVANGIARLMSARDVVGVALRHLRDNETVFLHAEGMCAECDSARAGMTRA